MARRRCATAVVTGAGRGIGRAIAMRFAADGMKLVLAARSEEEIESVAQAIRAQGGVATAVPCDVGSDDSVSNLRAEATDALGEVDALVNAAGVYVPGRFLDYELDDLRKMMDVNWLGTARVIRAFLPEMLAREHGRVVNIASTAGKYGSMYQSGYNSSKHAVVGLTRCLGIEMAGQGVRVNAICPGFVDTGMLAGRTQEILSEILGIPADGVNDVLVDRVPIGRFLDADEVAELATFLVGAAGDAMTGQALTISGGLILA